MRGLEKDVNQVYEYINQSVLTLEEIIDPTDHSPRAQRLDEAIDLLMASLGVLRELDLDSREDLNFNVGREFPNEEEDE